MKRILITGGSGFIGKAFLQTFAHQFETHISCHSKHIFTEGIYAHKLDIRNENAVNTLLSKIKPHYVLHMAAMSNFNECALNPTSAWETNVQGTKNIAMASQHCKARLVYISTDLVFKGDRENSREHDMPLPQSVYGKTKLEGERAVENICSDYLIARIANVFGKGWEGKKTFTDGIIEELKKQKEVSLFQDEYRTPIYAKNLCELLYEVTLSQVQGVLHLGGPERLSRYELGLKLAQCFGFDPTLIIPVSVKDFKFSDPRPLDCSLDSSKAAGLLKTPFHSIDRCLHMLRNEYGA
ncbi:MAG: SDR family oxidoreductase [Clostridia bacterium]|nr:SDR family oxidoreductase [Clostridia bacterium]